MTTTEETLIEAPRAKTLASIIPDLEKFCEWVKANADLPISHTPNISFTIGFWSNTPTTREQLAAWARALGKAKKINDANTYAGVQSDVGCVQVTVFAERQAVCTRRVVGTKNIPETHIPAQTIPARVEEVVEWDCHPILSHA